MFGSQEDLERAKEFMEEHCIHIGKTLTKKLMALKGVKLGFPFEHPQNGPAIVIEGIDEDFKFEFYLTNALHEIISIDRDDVPLIFDRGLDDDAYVKRKIENVLDSKVAVIRASIEGGNVDGIREKLEAMRGDYERLNIIEIDLKENGDDRKNTTGGTKRF